MRLTVTVPDVVAEHARQLAARTGQSVSAVVAAAVERHVAEARRRLAFDAVDALIGSAPAGASANASTEAVDFDRALHELRRSSDRDLS